MPEQPDADPTTPPAPLAPVVATVRSFDVRWVVFPLFAVVAAVGGSFGSFTLRANLLVLAVGGSMVWLGLSGRAGRRPALPALTRGALWWLLPIVALGLTELWAFVHTPRELYPTLSWLLDPVLDHYLPRAVAYVAWLGGFWVLVRR